MTSPLSVAGAAAAALVLLLLSPAPARAEWTRLGPGNCAAPDVSTSKGLSPTRAKCDASMGGMTAVCWDGTALPNPAMRGAGCVYKRVPAESCQGAANPGTIFRCDGFPLATPKATPAKGTTTTPPSSTASTATKTTTTTTQPAKKDPAPAPLDPSLPEPERSSARIKVQGYLNLAAELFAAKDYEGALTELKRAQASQDLAIVRFNIARCLEELERTEQTVQAFQDYLLAADDAAGAEVRRGYARQVIAFLTGANDLPAEAPPTAELGWRYLRVDDCWAAEAGNSEGPNPASPLCVPATEGNAAVCWDGVQQKNPAFKGPACVYKTVPAATCKGGENPGFLYECAAKGGAATATAPPVPRPAGAKTHHAWQYVGAGDCVGGDVGSSKGSDPVEEKCDAAHAGKLAVCWDGLTQRNPAIKGAGCSYKSVSAKTCKPGSTPGYVFECLAEGVQVSDLAGGTGPKASATAAAPATGATPATPAKATTTTPAAPPKPATPGNWVAAGAGDCVGNEVAISKGLSPSRVRCDSNHLGQVAVCWDGIKTRNPSLRGAGCSYKTTKAENCRGGPHPGTLFKCGP